ncbi:MAG: hypothetical protein WCK63_15505 [Betaproteobacteria bacterium]
MLMLLGAPISAAEKVKVDFMTGIVSRTGCRSCDLALLSGRLKDFEKFNHGGHGEHGEMP